MPPELIIFDCDGVLIDSEGIASAVIARDMSRLGWPMTTEQAHELFLGMSIMDMEPMIETRLGRRLPDGWRQRIAGALLEALGAEATLIPGALAMLERVTALGIPWRVASNSSDEEMDVKFKRTGIAHLTQGRTHAAASVIKAGGRPKPAPDIFLAAAAAGGAAPSKCLVLEDSAVGVTGAVAAGMTCLGFDPHGDGAHLLAAGATRILHNLSDLFGALA
jgi:HAD superfamily hydrolase (TIGR01509 family)